MKGKGKGKGKGKRKPSARALLQKQVGKHAKAILEMVDQKVREEAPRAETEKALVELLYDQTSETMKRVSNSIFLVND
jgi:hypothetical protein